MIDVRCNPIARCYGFHKTTTQRLCNDLGIEYLHFPSLGVPLTWRSNLSDGSSYEALLERYNRDILPENSADLDRVAALLADAPSALMCMEADNRCCHRSQLAVNLARRTRLPIRELRECP